MLRHGTAKTTNPVNTMSKSETFPGMLSLYPTPKPRKTAHSDSEPELEENAPYVAPPQQSIGDAIAQALEQACSLEPTTGNNETSNNSHASGKKKGKKLKGKKISLFAAARPNI